MIHIGLYFLGVAIILYFTEGLWGAKPAMLALGAVLFLTALTIMLATEIKK